MIHADAVKLFSSDLDNTVFGDPGAMVRFRAFWQDLPAAERPILCYNSGRLLDDQIELLADGPLPQAQFLIGGVGTEIYDVEAESRLDEYEERFFDGWDLSAIQAIVAGRWNAEPQPDRYQTPFKSSWYLMNAAPESIDELRATLAEQDLRVTVIYSSDRDLDVLPAGADKGSALAWLCERLRIDPSRVVVAGDTGNDSRMFRAIPVRGIVVGNARAELIEATRDLSVYRATAHQADGVIEGLKHFRIGSRIANQ